MQGNAYIALSINIINNEFFDFKMFDEIIKKLAELRISAEQDTFPEDEVPARLDELNRDFAQLWEDWLVLPPDTQSLARNDYLNAQYHFHWVASRWLIQITTTDTSATNDSDTASVPQLEFGEFPVHLQNSSAENSVTFTDSAVMTTATAATITAELSLSISETTTTDAVKNPIVSTEMQVGTSMQGEMEVDQSHSVDIQVNQQSTHDGAPPNLIPATKADQLNAPELRNLMCISFEQQTEVMKPVFALDFNPEVNEKAISNIIGAINAVVRRAGDSGVELTQPVIRTVILHVISSLDVTTRTCWAHHLRYVDEPTFDVLVDFLCQRRKDQDIQTGVSNVFTIPKNKMDSQPQNPKKQINRGRSVRSATPSPGPSGANKRIRNGPSVICPLCTSSHTLRLCPEFLKLSLEAREAEIYRRHLCLNCFSHRHRADQCEDKACKICGYRHNSLLHHRDFHKKQ